MSRHASAALSFGLFLALGAGLAPAQEDGAARPGGIYRCEAADVTVFSDRPCDARSGTYRPDASRVSIYDSLPTPAIPAGESRQTPASRQPRRAAQGAGKDPAQECARIRAALDGIRSKMRAGYRAAEGERLRERKARLDQRRRALKCR